MIYAARIATAIAHQTNGLFTVMTMRFSFAKAKSLAMQKVATSLMSIAPTAGRHGVWFGIPIRDDTHSYLTDYIYDKNYQGAIAMSDREWLCQSCKQYFRVSNYDHKACLNSPTPLSMQYPRFQSANTVSCDVLMGREFWPSWLRREKKKP